MQIWGRRTTTLFPTKFLPVKNESSTWFSFYGKTSEIFACPQGVLLQKSKNKKRIWKRSTGLHLYPHKRSEKWFLLPFFFSPFCLIDLCPLITPFLLLIFFPGESLASLCTSFPPFYAYPEEEEGEIKGRRRKRKNQENFLFSPFFFFCRCGMGLPICQRDPWNGLGVLPM